MATPHDDYYRVIDPPIDHTPAEAEEVESELERIRSGFNKLPTQNQVAFGHHIWGEEDTDHSGGANFYKITTEYPPVFPDGVTPAYRRGDRVSFIAKKTNTTTTPEANIDGVGDVAIREIDGSELPIGGIAANWPVELLYDGEVLRSQNTANRSVNFLVIADFIGNKAFAEDAAIASFVLPEGRLGTTPYVYAVTGLPSGLDFDTATRIVSGTPTTSGSWTVTYTVTDADTRVVTQKFRITILAQVSLVLPDPPDLIFIANNVVAGSVLPAASGGSSPYTYAVSALPSGLNFNTATRLVNGTPSVTGTFTITYTVTDSSAANLSTEQTFSITINPSATLSLTVVANQDYGYNAEIPALTLPVASGGIAPYSYQVTGLSAGLDFDTATRQVTGTPTELGQRTATYTVTDQAGETASRQFTVNISSENRIYTAVVASRTLDASTVLADSLSFASTALDLTLPTWTGTRYLVVLVPASLGALAGIVFNGAESLSDFERQEDEVTLSSSLYDAYVTNDIQGDSVSAFPLSIRR